MAPTLAPDPQLAALFAASVDDIWRLEHPPPTPAMVRLAAEAARNASQQRAAAAAEAAAEAACTPPCRLLVEYGERHSGTNLARQLFDRLFLVQFERTDQHWVGRVPARVPRFGVTHWFVPGHAGANASRASLVPAAAAADGPSALFVVRSPIGWSKGMYARPHHSPQPPGTSFRDFLRRPWRSYEDADPTWHGEPPHEATLERAPSLLALRYEKLRQMLSLHAKLPRSAVIKYEELVAHPEQAVT